jgi:hypothetical protein
MPSVSPLSLLSAVAVLDASLEGWSLLEPSAEQERVYQYRVAFRHAFSTPPVVQVSIVGLDVGKDDNLRVRVRAIDINETGFTIRAETWLHTQIWSVEVSWLAIGS